MAGLDIVVTANIAVAVSAITRAGFGRAGVLSATTPQASWSTGELTRVYTDADLDGDFLSTDPECLYATAYFAQTPRPENLQVCRLTSKPTMQFVVSVPAGSVLNSTVYTFKVNGQVVTFTSDASATNDEIIIGLEAALDALAISGVTTTIIGGAGSTQLQIDGSAGKYIYVELADANGLNFGPAGKNLLAVKSTTPNTSTVIATQLDAIWLERPEFYFLLNPYQGEALGAAIATWVEAKDLVYIQADSSTEIITVAESSATDFADDMKTANRLRTHVLYHHRPQQALDAGYVGARATTDPGTETWAGVTVAGVDATTLTSTHLANLEAKNAGAHFLTGSVARTRWGRTADGTPIDIVRLRDFMKARIQEDVFATIDSAQPKKVPGSDGGILTIVGAVRGVLEGLTLTNPPALESYTLTYPRQADRSSADKTARNLTGIQFTAVATGAIEKVKPITGVVTV
jgi:hypothetical protein